MKTLLLFILILFTSNAFSQSLLEYYISPDGDDGNPGTYQEPFATISRAFQEIPTDTNDNYGVNIFVLPGEYTQYVPINKGGRQDYPINIRAYDPYNKPVFNGDDANIFNGKSGVFRWSNIYNHIIIDGIVIENVTANTDMRGIWTNGDFNIIKNCELYTLLRSGIVIVGSYNIIEHNIVDNIIGAQGGALRGNNISVESYYENNVSRNCEYNLIQYNVLTNNITHAAVNIFPNTLDPDQPYMNGNKVKFNYINNTGSGIYTRYQVDMEIIGNVIVKTVEDYGTYGSNGCAIFFAYRFIEDHPVPYAGGNIKIFNNTIADNEHCGILNYNTNSLDVKNNIFDDNGSNSTPGDGHIIITFDTESISADIDWNCYYGTGHWRYGNGNDITTFEDWQSITGQDGNGINEDPLFVDPNNDDYSIQLHSPAKNAGTALAEVIEDLLRVKRPYWVNGVDIGAYELPEAQFRIGVTGLIGNTQIEHSIEAFGTYWEKNEGNWDISSDPGIENSSYTTVGNTSTDIEEWNGFRLKWMVYPETQSLMGHAFYKVSNESGAYFYLELRDAIVSYSPNIYIRYDADIQTQKYQFYDGNTFQNIDNGSILRIWQMKDGSPSTNNLEAYWDNVLLMIPDGIHPKLVYGPNTDIGSTNYLIYRKLGTGTYSYLTGTSNLDYTDNQYQFYYGDPPYYIYYKIKGENQLYQTPYSNEVYNSFHKSPKIASGNSRHFENILLQNYPNPFNPTTTISFTLKNSELVTMKVYDILGREVKTLVNEKLDEGVHTVNFNASALASGLYFYKITAGKFTAVKKLLLVR